MGPNAPTSDLDRNSGSAGRAIPGMRVGRAAALFTLSVVIAALAACGPIEGPPFEAATLHGIWMPDSRIMSVPILLKRPVSYALSGDGSDGLAQLTWRRWGAPHASASGYAYTRAWPQGGRTWHVRRFRATLTASRLRKCSLRAFVGDRGVRIRRVTVRVYTRSSDWHGDLLRSC